MKFLVLLALLFCSYAHAQTTVTPPPRCMIDQFYGNFHMGVSAAGDTVAIIWCDDQSGLTYWGMAGKIIPSGPFPPCLMNLSPPSWSLAWLQSAWSACATSSMNADQFAEFTILTKAWVPRLNVTGPANQNVYTANADGTRGPQLVIGGIGMQIAPGGFCSGARLKDAGARFADVSNYLSTNGMRLPAGSFALCSITYAPSTGFAN